MIRFGILLSGLFLLLTLHTTMAQSPSDTLSESQIRDLVRKSADNDVENTKRQRDYTYVQRTVERRSDGNGKIKSSETRTFEIMVLAGEPVRKLIAKDDKPLPEKEAKKEDERIQKRIAEFNKESENDRRNRIRKDEKETEDGRQFVREVADAFTFRFVGLESLDGRPAWVVDAEPIPGYKPRAKDADVLTKVRFRAWIDRADAQWAKLDVESIDTISFGLFLVRLHKGSRIHLEQTRVNDEVWLPKHFGAAIDARIAILKSMNLDLDITFRDYKKFVVETRILPAGETPAER